jgi:hypothetical protein
MDLMSAHPPAWFAMAVFAIDLYVIVGLVAARWTTDARVLVALPVLAGAAVGSYAVFDSLRVLERMAADAGAITRASVVLEALIPAFHGAMVAVVLSAAAACAWGARPARRRRTRAGTLMLAAGAAIVVTWVAVLWYVVHTPFSPASRLTQAVMGLCLLSGAGLAAALAVAFGRFRASEAPESARRWFVVFALLIGLAALSLGPVDSQLRGPIMP